MGEEPDVILQAMCHTFSMRDLSGNVGLETAPNESGKLLGSMTNLVCPAQSTCIRLAFLRSHRRKRNSWKRYRRDMIWNIYSAWSMHQGDVITRTVAIHLYVADRRSGKFLGCYLRQKASGCGVHTKDRVVSSTYHVSRRSIRTSKNLASLTAIPLLARNVTSCSLAPTHLYSPTIALMSSAPYP